MNTKEAIEILERFKPQKDTNNMLEIAIDMAIDALNFLRDYKDPNIFQVWKEGYAATCEHGTAYLLGVTHAENFVEAARKLNREKWIPSYEGDPHIADDFFSIRENGQPAIWGGGCFDNEADAMKNFG
jgi:hypothetical protein